MGFSEEEIAAIYASFVKRPKSYFTQYEMLPRCPVKAWNHDWRGHDFPRVWTILDFRQWIQKHAIIADALAYTCAADPELEFLPCRTRTLVEYPPHDLHTISSRYTDAFDFFLFNQTLEHLYDPRLAVSSIRDTLRPGGYVFTSVPTINIPHSTPVHFGGFTPMGLALLFRSADFHIVEMGQWGSYDYIRKLFLTHSWPGFIDLQKSGRVSNEERNVCQCWILAQKI